MSIQQIERTTVRGVDSESMESIEEEALVVSGDIVREGDYVEVLLPVGWKKDMVVKRNGEWAFAELPLNPIGLIVRTLAA